MFVAIKDFLFGSFEDVNILLTGFLKVLFIIIVVLFVLFFFVVLFLGYYFKESEKRFSEDYKDQYEYQFIKDKKRRPKSLASGKKERSQ